MFVSSPTYNAYRIELPTYVLFHSCASNIRKVDDSQASFKAVVFRFLPGRQQCFKLGMADTLDIDVVAAAAEEPAEGAGSSTTVVAAGPSAPAIPQPRDDLLARIRQLKDDQAVLRNQRKRIAKDLKNAERRRKRLKKKAKQLSDDDLVAVLRMRQSLSSSSTAASDTTTAPPDTPIEAPDLAGSDDVPASIL